MLKLSGVESLLPLLLIIVNAKSDQLCTISSVCSCLVTNETTLAGNGFSSEFNICNIANSTTVTKSPKYVLNCSHIDFGNGSTILQETITNETFFLNLTYPCTHPSPHDAKGYSTGSILVIIFFSCLFAYLALGIAVNYFISGARGVEVLPNLKFWRDLPGLVKDGAIFVQNGFKVPQNEVNPRSPESYDAI